MVGTDSKSNQSEADVVQSANVVQLAHSCTIPSAVEVRKLG